MVNEVSATEPEALIKQDLEQLIATHALDLKYDTRAFVLAEFLYMSLTAFGYCTKYRESVNG